jgi:Ca2+-transporting ATPase
MAATTPTRPTNEAQAAARPIEHALPAGQVLEQLGVDAAHGLTAQEVLARRERYGRNELTPPKSRGPLLRFLAQFNQPLVYILLVASLITLLLQEYVDSAVIFGVVLVNAVIGFLQESKAVKAIEALAKTMTAEATLLRGGEKVRVPAGEVVPGDILLLQAGDKVAADARLVKGRDLQVDESALTGESLPVEKRCDPVPEDTSLADRKNMVYSSALVTYGAGVAVVVRTGDHSEIGRISQLLASTEALATPLTRKINQFSHLLLWIIIALAAVTFAVGVARGSNWVEMFMAAVALAVGAIPEGLPAAITITLAIGVGRMARRNAIIRKLPAVETLGSTTVICSDKTGTLTQNEMTVRRIAAGAAAYEVTGQGYEPEGAVVPLDGAPPVEANAALRACVEAGVLASDSWLKHDDHRWRVEGDPTEGALLVSGLKLGFSASRGEQEWPRLDTIPFESKNQYMATLHRGRDGSVRSFVKGSAEAILARCSTALDANGNRVELDRNASMDTVAAMAAQGLRVLALAYGEHDKGKTSLTHEDISAGLTLLGFQGMIDPPRPEAITAVRACQSAGVAVKMITGDHAGTAVAIARQLGLDGAERGESAALTGRQLEEIPDAQLVEKAAEISVFARVSPEQKLRLVKALQERGDVVAMTGDGVNDAPALRRADIGVAMGITGTAVAQEAADMVLTDDNFASIEAAVEEGRAVFDNMVKFITWTLPTNVGEGLVILAAVFAGATLPILPVQLLWINMTTAVCLGLMLAFENKEPGIMQRAPRDPKQPILTRVLQARIALVSLLLLAGAFGLFEWSLARGLSLAEARTVAVNVFVFGELVYLFNCRSLSQSMFALGLTSNRMLLGGVSTMIVLQLLFTYTGWMNTAFHSAPMDSTSWAAVLACSGIIYISVFLEKALRRRFATSRELREE